MAYNEDSDIKIFGAKNVSDDGEDLLALVERMQRHRANGNSEKARVLGTRLTEYALDVADNTFPEAAANDQHRVVFNAKVLRLFVAEVVLYRNLPKPLAATAVDSMYDTIRSLNESFYSDVSDGAAFTFYYLAVRKPDSEHEIGECFAMLCKAEDDDAMIELGMTVLSLAQMTVNTMIEMQHFVDLNN